MKAQPSRNVQGKGSSGVPAGASRGGGLRSGKNSPFAALTHDLREALWCIAGYAEWIENAGESLRVREAAESIVRLSRVVTEMVDELGAHARLDGEGSSPGSVSYSPRQVLLQCAEAFSWRCQEKGLEFEVSPPDEGVAVGDPAVLRRVLINLLSNAVRYTPSGKISLRAVLGPTSLAVSVSDTGIGIPPSMRERIFEEAVRLDEARKLAPLGSGLGLATVKRLVEESGGAVRVSGTATGGTRFDVVLPRFAREPSRTGARDLAV
ncbi:MAG: hypothetical protein KatS3mg076_2078 [Candidatus Binatia bacterium]|nr:MAG: hypothetical protein KatS3mg076_2078 [Candidatus Binatia bacterium]